MSGKGNSRLRRLYEATEEFLAEKWVATQDEVSTPRLQRVAHFWVLVVRSFVRNRCPVRAAALGYSTLLALIPMLAVVLSVTTSILKTQGEAPIRGFINNLVDHVAPYTNPGLVGVNGRSPEARALAAAKREEAVKKINEFIANTQSGAIGVTGMVALILVAIAMLGRIEETFNDIWGVTRGRSWYMRIVLYWTTITLGPLVLIVALGLASGPHFATTKQLFLSMPVVGNLLFKLVPILVLCLTFAMFYQLIPNTRVQFQGALVGGVVAGLLWHLNNVFGIYFVSRVTRNNAIYGSLGTVPVLMIGLYLGWLILLFGAQVAYAFQNRRAYLQERRAEGVNQRGREFIALRVMTLVAQRFLRGEPPAGMARLAATLGVPSRLVGQVLQSLLQAGLVVEAQNRESGYSPARPLENVTAHDVLMALRAGQGNELTTREDDLRARVRSQFERIQQAERDVAGSVTLAELAGGETETLANEADPAAPRRPVAGQAPPA
jgi:membrane protein